MARGKLWSVKGVTAEARDAAKSAAQGSGQTIGNWIDQAIRMNDEDGQPPTSDDAPAQNATDQVDIVAILQALEARVADHADRISEQLAPVRQSIGELANRLEQIEAAQVASADLTSTTSPAPMPAAEPEQTSEPQPEQDSPPPRENLRPADLAGTSLPPELSQETVHADEPESANPATEDATPPQPDDISEEDIHAADAALKSELTGLFDDGVHRDTARQRMQPEGDPFLPPRPPRPTSRAPLVFVVIILIAACAGIGAVAWFEFLSPEARLSLTSQFTTSETRQADTAEPVLGAPTETITPPPATPAQPPSSAASATPSIDAAPAIPATEAPSAPEPVAEVMPASVTAPEPEPVIAPETTAPTPASTRAPDPVETSAPPVAEPATEPATADAAPLSEEVEALRREAEAGSASAQNDLGVRYLVGRGVAQDFTVAAEWLRRAAAQDMTNAQYNLGVLYDSGRGVDPDPTEALIWFHSAAEKGHGRAQMAVAAAYAAGRGIERNPDEALKWLRQAAESNVGEAQFSLANILATSPSSHESLIDAYYWYRVADANGNSQASERAEQVASRLTAEERAGVNARVSHFLGRNLPKSPARRAASTPKAPIVPAAPAPTPTPTPTPSSGDISQEQISQIQNLLSQLGFDPGPADGRPGTKTSDAISSYQKELGLPVNGEASPTLLAHLLRIAGER